MFLDLLDPDPLVKAVDQDPAPDPSVSLYLQKVISRKTFFGISFYFASVTKIAGSASGSESGSISQRHGSADPNPHQNCMDPEHCFQIACTLYCLYTVLVCKYNA
jgi:hypothetical protein